MTIFVGVGNGSRWRRELGKVDRDIFSDRDLSVAAGKGAQYEGEKE
jgi:hypothetical protein